MRLCIRLTEFDVARGKNALVTNLALALDGTTPLCDEIGRQMLLLGYRTPFRKLAQDIMVSSITGLARVLIKLKKLLPVSARCSTKPDLSLRKSCSAVCLEFCTLTLRFKYFNLIRLFKVNFLRSWTRRFVLITLG